MRVAASIFVPLADANINVDMIVQNLSVDGNARYDVYGAGHNLPKTLDVLKTASKTIGYFDVTSSTDVAKISVIGVGMRSHAGVAAQMFKALADKASTFLAITTSEIKISVLIDAAYPNWRSHPACPVRFGKRLISLGRSRKAALI